MDFPVNLLLKFKDVYDEVETWEGGVKAYCERARDVVCEIAGADKRRIEVVDVQVCVCWCVHVCECIVVCEIAGVGKRRIEVDVAHVYICE